LCEIEAVLNSRPLTPLSSDPNDLAYFTPGHFLIGGALNDFPCPDLTDIKQNRLIRWQRVEQLVNIFGVAGAASIWTNCSNGKNGQLTKANKSKLDDADQITGPFTFIMDAWSHKWDSSWSEWHRPVSNSGHKGSIVRPLSKLSILPLKD